MKLSKFTKLILILLIVVISFISTRKYRYRRNKNKKNKQLALFKNKAIKQDPKRFELLTNAALNESLLVLGYPKNIIDGCINTVPYQNKNATLRVFIKTSRTGVLSPEGKTKIETYWNCPQIIDLVLKMQDPSKVAALKVVVEIFTRKQPTKN